MSTGPAPTIPPGPPPVSARRDAAATALSDALAVSFGILKLVMGLLLVALLFSGVFRVPDNEVALVLRMGKPVGEPPEVYKAGLHFAWIQPIDEKIFFWSPLAEQTLNIESFWPMLSPADRNKPFSEVTATSEGLRPGVDGALLTADQNLVHIKLTFRYRVKDPTTYASRLYDDPSLPNDLVPPEKQLLIGIIEAATVKSAAVCTADAIARSQAGLEDLIRQNAYQGLVRVGLADALEIVEVRIPEKAVPLQVRSSFEDVTKAENQKREITDSARREANNTLIAAVGADWQKISAAITRYTHQVSPGTADQPTTEIDALLSQASGKVAEILTQARTEATETVSDISNKRKVFEELLPQYRKNPAIVRQWLWADMVQTVLGDPQVEKTFLDPTVPAVLRLQGRDPSLGQQREMDAYKKRTEGMKAD